MRPAGTPLRAAAASGVESATRARMRARSSPVMPAACTLPSSTMVRTIAAATAPSAPGSMRIHSSALDAVSESRGSKWTVRTVLPFFRTPGVGERPGLAHGGQPGLQEVRAERQDQIGAAEVVRGHRGAIEQDAVGGPQRLVGERLVPQAARSADGRGPAVDQGVQGYRTGVA